MPAFCTHYLFAKDMQSWINQNEKSHCFENVINIGTQGPDIFFFKRVLPVFMPGKAGFKIGSMLHKSQIEKILKAFAEYLKENDNDIARSYVIGFILHYALDKNCHPYVYAMQKKITDKNRFIHTSSAHNRVEMALDSYLLHQKLNIDNFKEFCTADTIVIPQEQKEEIERLVSYIVDQVLGIKLEQNDVVMAINDSILFQNILRDKTGLLKPFCMALETVFAIPARHYKLSSFIRPTNWKKGLEYANIESQAWTSPFDNSKHNESFEELYEKALAEAKVIINNFDKMLNGEIPNCNTNNISFLNGMEVL